MFVCGNGNATVLETLDALFLYATDKPLSYCITTSFEDLSTAIIKQHRGYNSKDLCKVDVNRKNIVLKHYTYHQCNSYKVISYLSQNLEYLHKDIKNNDIIRFNVALDRINERICNEYSVRALVQSKTSDSSSMSYQGHWDKKFKNLQKVRMVKNFFPIDANDFEGFGIRLKI